MTAPPDVLIVGAGVCGLTAGVRLAELGVRVRIRTERPPQESSSAAAGAIWDPMQAAHPRVHLWSSRTYDELVRMASSGGQGVCVVDGVEAARTPLAPPPWIERLPGFRRCTREELPPGFVVGWRYRAPLVDMPTYLRRLQERLLAAGGELVAGRLEYLAEGFAEAPIVINCTGAGARELAPDAALEPSRGQLVVVRNPGVREFFIEKTDDGEFAEVTYLLPQGDVLLLGGSAEPQNRQEPDLRVARGIVDRCAVVLPAVAAAEVLAHRVGIRPVRDEIRLDHIDHGDHHLIHNYGHGGSGVSVSWGCADDIADLVKGLLGRA